VFLQHELASLGLKPTPIEVAPSRFNLLCTVGSGRPRICLNAHSDTVPANGRSVPSARIDGDLLFGLGSCDTKASVAAMITAALDLAARPNLTGTVDLLISVDEEGDGIGVRSAIKQGYKCDYAIVGEPTSLNLIRVHCGLLFLKLTTRGVAAHGCDPSMGVSAIDRMLELINAIRGELTRFPAHPVVGQMSLNVGEIHAGDRPNRVPDRCEARIDIRIVPPITNEQVFEAVRDVVDRYPWASYEVEKRGEPVETPQTSPLVESIMSAAKELGISTVATGFRGWTEAESFKTGLGVDAVVIGPGAVQQAHSSDEFVSISETHRAAELYVESVLRLLATG
ncbi:MAG: M20 family metallopeptidase, partial [Armatimonadota bacterium]|nr:M20 family metallopeptidase [Armatimonadota bacterium]